MFNSGTNYDIAVIWTFFLNPLIGVPIHFILLTLSNTILLQFVVLVNFLIFCIAALQPERNFSMITYISCIFKR